MAARMPIITTTIINSISVNPWVFIALYRLTTDLGRLVVRSKVGAHKEVGAQK